MRKIRSLAGRARNRKAAAPPPGTTHVLEFAPSWQWDPPSSGDGMWVMQPIGAWQAGDLLDFQQILDESAGIGEGGLAPFAVAVLGYPVALTRFEVEVRATGRRPGGWEIVPGYYVARRGAR